MGTYWETKFDDHADHEESCIDCGNVESQCMCEKDMGYGEVEEVHFVNGQTHPGNQADCYNPPCDLAREEERLLVDPL